MYLTVNEKKVFASTGGKPFEKNQPVVLFLHGSGLDHTFWGLHSRFFAFRKYSVLCLDFPGHTHSDGPPLESIEEMATWVNDVIIEIQASAVSVVGHSQGCLVSMEYVSKFPELVKSVSFIASGYETPVNSFLLDAAENKPRNAIDKMMSWCFDKAGHMHQGTIPGNSMIAGGYKIMQGNVPNELFADLNACNNYKDGKKAASNIKAPCQLIIGGKDKMAPRKSTMALAETLPSSTNIEIIQESGHMVPLETPNQCRDLLKTFIFTNNPTS
ncbi:MAG: pimeloyl-ACP methyl ester carboxylesterase [Woeseiaceae bacterium]|jgi:pimeloyl-ACP methyl ester carboxylesterase|tara:strand:- start:536 stop:1348 length:813 start_codon:yes stop_codon:yes gene_type:complete